MIHFYCVLGWLFNGGTQNQFPLEITMESNHFEGPGKLLFDHFGDSESCSMYQWFFTILPRGANIEFLSDSIREFKRFLEVRKCTFGVTQNWTPVKHFWAKMTKSAWQVFISEVSTFRPQKHSWRTDFSAKNDFGNLCSNRSLEPNESEALFWKKSKKCFTFTVF